MQRSDTSNDRKILIIGSGFSGLCLAIHLKQAGFKNFTLLEQSSHIGGTWRENAYPGATCDIPALAYSYSFEPKTDWTRRFAEQGEILAYIEHCFEKHKITPHVRFDSQVIQASFDDSRAVWTVELANGDTLTSDILVSGVGQLSRPYTPDITGLDDFKGTSFHSARWNANVDLDEKRVAVIGTAASAVQLVPRVASHASHLSVFQRSANWILPKNDRVYTKAETERFARHPWLAQACRWWIWARFEMRFPAFHENPWLRNFVERLALASLAAEIQDPERQRELTPDYPLGGKRILASDDYYQTLCEPHVDLVTSPIERVTESGILEKNGTHHEADVLIFATGFSTTHFLAPIHVKGRHGRHLDSSWQETPRTYLGIATSGLPNFFMMYGPNTNLGHNSILFMIECQSAYILQCIEAIHARDLAFIDLYPEVLDEYQERLHRDLSRTVWAQVEKSWYKNEAGVITNNWPNTGARYWWKTRKANLDLYECVSR